MVVIELATREFDIELDEAELALHDEAELDEAELGLHDEAELDLLSFGFVIGRICLHSFASIPLRSLGGILDPYDALLQFL